MGVHGLWELLSPVGHRVSNDSVRNKVLAVDVSIWITQFVKAMRDTEGAQLRNSHLLGIFRRCVKLLYLSVKPVLVFDGATPALKRKTLSSRRAQREKHEAKLRRLAEKMLLNRIKRRTLDSLIAKKRERHNPKRVEPMSLNKTGYRRAALQGPGDNVTVTEQVPPRVLDHVVPLDVPYEDSDIDDDEIDLPPNVNDLDDQVLMNLPTKVQAEVFKQVKLEQRARHRENMIQKRQDPTEFSQMQIEGFLHRTALNRKISRVRKVTNSKTGASQRIASDCGRNFVLEEEGFTETHGETEASGSGIECRESGSSKEIEAYDATDLLASIRARKETVHHEAPESRTQHQKKLMHNIPYRESGTDWASKVLEGHGGLSLRTTVPGDSRQGGEKELSSHSDDNSDLRLEEQRRSPTRRTDNNRSSFVTLAKEPTNTDMSDDDEWEDGSQPVQQDLSGAGFPNFHRRGMELSTLSNISKGEEQPKLGERVSQEPHTGTAERECHVADIEEHHQPAPITSPGKDRNAVFRTDQGTSNRTSHRYARDPVSLGSNIPASRESTAMSKKRKAASLEESTRVRYEEENLGSVVKEGLKECTAGVNQRTEEIDPRDDCTHSKLPRDGLQLIESGKAHGSFTYAQGAKPGSLIGPEDSIDPSQRHGVGKNSKTENVAKRRVPATSGKKRGVVDKGMPLSNVSGNPNISQAKGGINLDETKVSIQKGSSSRYAETEALDSSSTRDTSDLHEKGVGNVNKGEGLRNKVNAAECNATSADHLPPTPESLNTQHTTKETPSDNKYEEQYALKQSQPAQTDEQEPSLAHLESMQKELDVEAREMSRQRSLHRGGADSVAEEMYEETRDLIKLFGIPYLEAPMEAEAQCAFLNKEKLVDGVLTEDSDAFLFGAVTVYRQLFAEGRFAEAYDADDIQQSLGLSRHNLIRLAYLLGSDYTAGVRGVGIVNSMEILEAFPGSSGLKEFREWTKSVTILDEEPDEEVMTGKKQEAVRRRFCWKHRNMKRNWEVRDGFPNPAVFEAYINPVIDNYSKRFSWGPVDFEGLAKFCWDKFGWEQDRFESAVGPLRQQLEEKSRTTQRRIDEFFKPHRFARIRSERLQRAVHGMVGDSAKELMVTNRPAVGKQKVSPVTHRTELSDLGKLSEHGEDMDKPADNQRTRYRGLENMEL